jgi:hypothetical protein
LMGLPEQLGQTHLSNSSARLSNGIASVMRKTT